MRKLVWAGALMALLAACSKEQAAGNNGTEALVGAEVSYQEYGQRPCGRCHGYTGPVLVDRWQETALHAAVTNALFRPQARGPEYQFAQANQDDGCAELVAELRIVEIIDVIVVVPGVGVFIVTTITVQKPDGSLWEVDLPPERIEQGDDLAPTAPAPAPAPKKRPQSL